ncbi:MAG: hypothetical protein IT317_20220 [Anaerolineales bacterium]|nr:hypothetical protein [Anaerolineales bacterium]
MTDLLDVSAHWLNVSGGRATADEPPGFLSLAAPRKAARGREKDALFLCLGLRAREAAPPEQYDDLLQLAAHTFYGSPGSATSALRAALAAVNQRLLDTNLGAGAPTQGGLVAAVLRGTDFYAVQGGPGLLLVIRPTGHERFPNAPTRPLGQSNTLDALYFHTSVAGGDYFCFCSQPPRGWTDIALVGLGNLTSLEAVAERLRETAGPEAAALLGRFEAANGDSHAPIVPPRRPEPVPRLAQPSAEAAPEPESEASAGPPTRPTRRPRGAGLAEFFRLKPRPAPNAEPEDPAPDAAGVTPTVAWGGAPPPDPAAVQPDLPHFLADRGPALPQAELDPPAEHASAAESPRQSAPPTESRPGLLAPLARPFRALGRALGVTLAEGLRGVRRLLARLMPEGTLQKDGLFIVPTSVQIGLAILIPVLVVGTAVWLYLENGRNEQYVGALREAQWAVSLGRAAPDELSARPHWEAALEWAATAEAIRPGQPEVAALRQEAQGKLDTLDWVTRLDFQPLLINGLGAGTQLTRLVLAGADIYALDRGSNRVLRITANPLGAAATGSAPGAYTVDTAFACSGGQTVRDVTIGQLIDLTLVPGPTVLGGDTTLSGDVLLALDSLGALLYCSPGLNLPYASYLTAPETGWVRPVAMELYADRLYVFDPGSSEIWQYQASGGAFSTPPARYFTTVSYNLSDVAEFSIAGGDVFLLRADGRVANCTRSGPGSPAACVEAMTFSDQRPGRAAGDRLADVANPLALSYDQPPEPSLYLLDGQTSGIYQLSLKLVLVRQFRPYYPLAGPISAVAIDPSKRLYAAAGDNVYVAARP